MYDEQTGKRLQRHGKPQRRKPGSAPCAFGRCKKGSPDNQATLSDRNVQAYQHYLECKAVGRFPDDPIVARNAAAIMVAERHADDLMKQLTDQARTLSAMSMGR